MNQLRLVYGNSPMPLNSRKKRPAKCERWRSTSRLSSQSLSVKMVRLMAEKPHAAAFIEELVDRALRERTHVG